MREGERRLQSAAHVATIIASLGTICALAWGVHTFYEATEAQSDAVEAQLFDGAVGALQEYFLLSAQNADAERYNDGRPTREYVWLASYALFTSDTINALKQGDPEWDNTVRGILDDHKRYILGGNLPCEQHSEQFVRFVENHFDRDLCPDV